MIIQFARLLVYLVISVLSCIYGFLVQSYQVTMAYCTFCQFVEPQSIKLFSVDVNRQVDNVRKNVFIP